MTPLTLITGKGGVGKSTVAATLARHWAAGGVSVLLVEIARAGSRSATCEVTLTEEPTRIAPNLELMRLDGHVALKSWVRRRTTFGRLYEPLLDQPPVIRFLQALPAFEELLSLGQLHDQVSGTRRRWQRVIVDAPATGHFRSLLRVPVAVLDALAAGPVRENTEKLWATLCDPQKTRVIAVSTPAETPLQEAREIVEFSREIGMGPASIVLNRVRSPRFSDQELDLLAATADNSVDHSFQVVRGLIAAAESVARAEAVRTAAVRKLHEVAYTFPEIDDGTAVIEKLEAVLAEQPR